MLQELEKKIPEGVALDKFGNPTTDAKKALEGVQLPIAGYRGSGFACPAGICNLISPVFSFSAIFLILY